MAILDKLRDAIVSVAEPVYRTIGKIPYIDRIPASPYQKGGLGVLNEDGSIGAMEKFNVIKRSLVYAGLTGAGIYFFFVAPFTGFYSNGGERVRDKEPQVVEKRIVQSGNQTTKTVSTLTSTRPTPVIQKVEEPKSAIGTVFVVEKFDTQELGDKELNFKGARVTVDGFKLNYTDPDCRNFSIGEGESIQDYTPRFRQVCEGYRIRAVITGATPTDIRNLRYILGENGKSAMTTITFDPTGSVERYGTVVIDGLQVRTDPDKPLTQRVEKDKILVAADITNVRFANLVTTDVSLQSPPFQKTGIIPKDAQDRPYNLEGLKRQLFPNP